jgi:CheY-like chemotaxis protein
VRTVVCEDDPAVRAVIAALAEEHHHEVMAETDNSVEALALVDRFGAEILVLDLALSAGSGTDLLDAVVQGLAHPVHVIVFSAFAHGIAPSHDVSVIDKPDFDRLAATFEQLAAAGMAPDVAERRRESTTDRAGAAVRRHGADDPHDFYTALTEARAGDALLTVRVAEAPLEMDELVTTIRAVARVQDRVLRQDAGVVVLLVGGSFDAPMAVSARLSHAWCERSGQPMALQITSAVVADGDVPIDVFSAVCEHVTARAGDVVGGR